MGRRNIDPSPARRRLRALRGALCAGLLWSLAPIALAPDAAHGTVVVIPSLDEMARKSDVVVHARVVDQTIAMEDGRIVTHTTIEVIEPVKGAKQGELLTIYQVGGALNGTRAWIVGAHRFALHDEVVLFAVRKAVGATTGPIVTYGIGVGVFEVVRDEAGARAVERIGDVVVAQPDGRTTAPQARAPVALDALLTDLRRAAHVKTMKAPPGALRVIKRPVEVKR